MSTERIAHVRSASIVSSNSDISQSHSLDGYHRNIYEDKLVQMENVIEIIKNQGFLPVDLIPQEVSWFYK